MKKVGWPILAWATTGGLLIGACSDNVTEVNSAAPQAQSSIRADDVVTMSDTSFGCEFESKFVEALEHYRHEEYSAWARITADAPWCFNGAALSKNQKWTVLQVRGDAIQIAQTTAQQYESDPSRYKHSYWTAVRWATKIDG